MKTTFNGNNRWWKLAGSGGLALAVWFMAVAPVVAEEDAPEYRNEVTLGGGSTFVNGDKAQFQRRQQMVHGVYGGIESLLLEQDMDKTGLLRITGHGIYDAHDNALTIELSDPNKGYIRFGHEQFRTWYDGSGGFFPNGTTNWISLYDEELAIDRIENWVEVGLTLPDMPVIKLRFSHDTRSGKKDSTVWGDATVLGGQRGIAPTFLGIDEKRDTVELDVTHTIGKTELGVGGRYERLDNNNSRNIHRRPGEMPPGVSPGSDRYITQREILDEDLFNVHASAATRFNDRIWLTLGGSYTTLCAETAGSRIYGNDYDPSPGNYSRSQQRDEGFYNLMGVANVDQYVGNLNLMVTPVTNLALTASLRFEYQETKGDADFVETTVNSANGPLVVVADLLNTADRDFLQVSEGLEARYTGIKNFSFYARGNWSETCGNQSELEKDIDTGTIDLYRNNDWQRLVQKYTVGANWYAARGLNFGGQYYYKRSDYNYDFLNDPDTFSPPTTNDLYPLFVRSQNFKTHDFNFRAHWRPASMVSMVARYDFQWSTVDMKCDVNDRGVALAELQSGELKSHIISGTVNWTPMARMYVQGGAVYSLDNSLTTPAASASGATALVPNLENSYWTANGLVGYLLTDSTDLQLQYTYFHADNYVNNGSASQPFGTSADNHGITATVGHQLSDRARVSLKYGFFDNRDTTSGGHNNYTAHMVYASMQYRF